MKVLIYGAGQLARMMYLVGVPLGIEVNAVDVATEEVVNPVSKTPVGLSLIEAIASADAISVEFEHVPEQLLAQAQASGKLMPDMNTILTGADRVREKRVLDKLGIANCAHHIVDDVAQLDAALEALGDKLIIKASRDGYDGYGQWRLTAATELPELKKQLAELDLKKVPLVVEQMVQFDRELSILGTRNKQGDIRFYPLAQNLHHQGQLHVSVAPAPMVDKALEQQARAIFKTLAEGLDYIGVLAVELFQVNDRLLVNEIAPRVHNSGHWSMQGADCCQFENHLRAVLGLPLGDTSVLAHSAMINVIGTDELAQGLMAIPGCHMHLYGKSVRAKRKMGHINLVAESFQLLGAKMEELAWHLPMAFFPKLSSEAERLKQES